MAAYGAVVSLLRTLDTILDSGGPLPISLDGRQLESLREKVNFLQKFLEYHLRKTSNQEAAESLETKIRDAAFRAEDLIDYQLLNLSEPEIGRQLDQNPESGRQLDQNPEIEHQLDQNPEIEHQLDQNPLLPSLIFVLKNVTIFVWVKTLCPFAVKKFLPVRDQNSILLAVQIVTTPVTILYSAPFLVKHVVQVLTKAKLPLIWSKFKSKFCKKERSVTMQDEQHNSEPEDWGLGQLVEEKGLGQVIEDIESMVNEVIKMKASYGAEDLLPTRNFSPAASSSRGDLGVTGKNVVVGFDSDLEEMRSRLTEDSSKLEIVSIVGMGGIGKTTLAREVYNDSYIIYHFDIRAWATISQEYSLRQVLVDLLDSAKLLTEKMYEKREEELAEYLYKSLKGRRYLMVMDDMWDTEIWDAVRRSFPDDSNGSRVVLTTRLSEVALYPNSSGPLHRMHFLNQDDSWSLLRNKAFGEKYCPYELVDIGKEIAGSCEGLPLAIAVIGGLLSKVSRTKENWRGVADNLSSIVTKDDEQCMEILSLSYNHLPHRLRPCFLYMSVFLEDYEIPVPKLIRLWAAEGFLKPHSSTSVEELAEEYLEDLIERNLILVSKRSANGKVKTCNIHDLLRNLCMRTAQKENFLYVVQSQDDVLQEAIVTPRRLSIHPNFLSIQSELLYNSKIHNSSVHSLLCTGARLVYPSSIHLYYGLLRVMDLIIVCFFHFPVEIVKLVNLRYLALTYNEALPPSISELQNLETLVHHNWTYRQCSFLPLEIWTMPKLRHLCVTPCFLRVPDNVQILVPLENLQTLLEVRNFRCSENILTMLPNLKKLGFSYDVSPSAVWSSYHVEALVNLHQLESLKLLVKNLDLTPEIVNPQKIAFPQSLKRLILSGCAIPWTSMGVIGALPNLEVLKLRSNACRGTDWEPVEGEFGQLKHLLLEEVDLVRWSADETHFPSLRCLIIRSCYRLKEIPSGVGEITTLELMELVDCHPSAVASAKQIEEEQESMGNVDLKVHVDLRRRFKDKFYSRVLH